MVDYNPWKGNFAGTVVANNHLFANSTMIKVGIAIGSMTWGSNNDPSVRPFGGIVKDNLFTSGPNGYFGYGV